MYTPDGHSVFISYSHADGSTWLAKFARQLKPLVRETLLNIWSDQDLCVGAYWYDAIVEAIEKADVAILLVTPEYLASDFVSHEEVPRLLERRRQEGMLIVPVICDSCLWRRIPWLSSMLVRPQDGRPLSVRRAPLANAEITLIIDEVLKLVSH